MKTLEETSRILTNKLDAMNRYYSEALSKTLIRESEEKRKLTDGNKNMEGSSTRTKTVRKTVPTKERPGVRHRNSTKRSKQTNKC